jgi:hypothetical protein
MLAFDISTKAGRVGSKRWTQFCLKPSLAYHSTAADAEATRRIGTSSNLVSLDDGEVLLAMLNVVDDNIKQQL